MNNTHLRNILLSISSGILLALAFPPLEVSLLAWIGMVPILLVINKTHPRAGFLYAYLTGIVFFALNLYWLVNVSVPGMILLIAYLAIFFGLFGLVTVYALRSSVDLFVIPFAWVLLEYVRSHLFTGFAWSLIGYSQYKTMNLIQIADFAGTYGVSFLIITFNIAIFALISRNKRRVAFMIATLFLLILATIYSIYRLDNFHISGNPRIGVVQGNVPQRNKWDQTFAKEILEKYTGLTKEAAKENPAFIIWPETSYPYLVEGSTQSAQEIDALAAETKIPILAGFVCEMDEKYYNSAALFLGNGSASQIYRKTHLVPFGEYIPFEQIISFLRNFIDKPIGNYSKGKMHTLFPFKFIITDNTYNIRTRRINFYDFGVLICFEDVFPYISRTFVKKGANFLVNITNDAWFGKTAAAKQHMQASVFRAIENRVPVIRAANTGISCFIDYTGKVISKVEVDSQNLFIEGYDVQNINMCVERSFYTQYGDIFIALALLITLLIVVGEIIVKKRALKSSQQIKEK